jgi:hypothetical protein
MRNNPIIIPDDVMLMKPSLFRRGLCGLIDNLLFMFAFLYFIIYREPRKIRLCGDVL